jgi:hypothetical protein
LNLKTETTTFTEKLVTFGGLHDVKSC